MFLYTGGKRLMPASLKERQEIRKSYRLMNTAQKADYIWTYYKLPIITAIIAAAVLISSAVSFITRRETVLCAAFVNVSVGDDLQEKLTDHYLLETERDLKKYRIVILDDLYLSDDSSSENHQYAYASKLKVLASINARQLDIALMNKEAYDLMSSSGFLLNLDIIPEQYPELYETLQPDLCTNTIILEDNAVAYSLGEADVYESVTEEQCNAVDCSSFAVFREARFDSTVYLGIIANTANTEECIRWLTYISRTAN